MARGVSTAATSPTLQVSRVPRDYILSGSLEYRNTEEEVIRRRLLIDGDGTGDDRRINVLQKTLTKWCSTADDTSQESKAVLDKMLAQLAQCEFAVTKAQLCSMMTAAELKSYEALSKILEEGIITAKLDIERYKIDLAKAKTVRKNRIEYDVLAKVISEQPDRRDTMKRLETYKSELDKLENTKQQLESRLGLRRKQFHVLVNSIHQLQAFLDEPNDASSPRDEPDVEMLSSSLDDIE